MASSSIAVKEADSENTTVPNWLELPRDITANILQRLDAVDIVTSVCQVCPLWWNICKDPVMRCTIKIQLFDDCSCYSYTPYKLEKICRYAIKRSCGGLINIDIKHVGTDSLLECISENASNLRCIRLEDCFDISDKGFIEAVRKLPHLEEVKISRTNLSQDSLEVLGRSCPLLKSLQFTRMLRFILPADDNEAHIIAETMSTLSHLDIKGNRLTDIGLLDILDGCPLLESLNIEDCFNLELNESLKKRCLDQIKDFKLPNLDTSSYYYCGDNLDFDYEDYYAEYCCYDYD